MPSPQPHTHASAPLTARDLTVTRNAKLVAHVEELRLEPGELVRLSAPSGAGKSTVLLALARLIPFSGSLTLGDKEASELAPHQWRKLVTLATHPPICLEKTIGEELAAPFALGVRREQSPPPSGEQEELLADLGLDFPLPHPTERLSQGERSRVALARTLITGPSVLLLDEPTANLDTVSAKAVAKAVEAYVKEGGCALVAAHDEAWKRAHRGYRFNATEVEPVK